MHALTRRPRPAAAATTAPPADRCALADWSSWSARVLTSGRPGFPPASCTTSAGRAPTHRHPEAGAVSFEPGDSMCLPGPRRRGARCSLRRGPWKGLPAAPLVRGRHGAAYGGLGSGPSPFSPSPTLSPSSPWPTSGVDVGLVETAGGVPLSAGGRRRRRIAVPRAHAGPPGVLVADAGLGTINAVRLTTEALRAIEVPQVVVLNRFDAVRGSPCAQPFLVAVPSPRPGRVHPGRRGRAGIARGGLSWEGAPSPRSARLSNPPAFPIRPPFQSARLSNPPAFPIQLTTPTTEVASQCHNESNT